MSDSPAPPLSGVRVIEFAGLAPGPFTGMVLADFGASVTRIDRAGARFSSDVLCRHKRSLSVSLRSPRGASLMKTLISQADAVIDPFRPGVLERLGLGPDDCRKDNEGLVYARLSGFRRTGEYATMAGHDINYLALSGMLSMLGTIDKPRPPMNLVADFAGGGLLCALGIALALYSRATSPCPSLRGKGQVVEADMLTGSRYVGAFPLLLTKKSSGLPMFSEPRGHNILDGGAPWYDTYMTKDGKHMALGAMEPHFYAQFLNIFLNTVGSHAKLSALPRPTATDQLNRLTWASLRSYLTAGFSLHSRDDWAAKFMGTDACCVPVLEPCEVSSSGAGVYEADVRAEELEEGGWPAPAPRLVGTPAKPVDCGKGMLLAPGRDTTEVLQDAGLSVGEIRKLIEDGIVEDAAKSKL